MKPVQMVVGSVVLLAVFLIYQKYDPALHSFFPRCPLLVCTGLYCPGCGSQRALHQVLHGHVAAAAGYNFLAVLYLPLIAGWYISVLSKKGRLHRQLTQLFHNRWFIYTTLALVVLFGLLRNTDTYLGHLLAPHRFSP